MGVYRVDKLMSEARKLAAEYRKATGRTLAISGEIAINDAIMQLGLEPAPRDATGYDATRKRGDTIERRQIKGRAVFGDKRQPHRLGQLKLDKPWDIAVLVLMDEEYEPFEMIEATHSAIENVLAASKPNRRGSISVARFKIIGERVWTRDGGIERADE